MENQLFRPKAIEYRFNKSGSPVIIGYKLHIIFYIISMLVVFFLLFMIIYNYEYRQKINISGYVNTNKGIFELFSNISGFIISSDVHIGHKFNKNGILYTISYDIKSPYFTLQSNKSIFPVNLSGFEVLAPDDGICISEGYAAGKMISKGDKLVSFISGDADLEIEIRENINILPSIKTGMLIYFNDLTNSKLYNSTIDDITFQKCDNQNCDKTYIIKIKNTEDKELKKFLYENMHSKINITIDLGVKHMWN